MLWCFAARPSLDFGYDNSWLVHSAFGYGVYVIVLVYVDFSLPRNLPFKIIAGS